MNTAAAALWADLARRGWVSGAMPAPSAAGPWYVRAMQGLAAWFASLFLLGFLASALAFVFEDKGAGFALGMMLCGAAFAIFRRARGNEFAVQFALALSLAGQFLVFYAVGFDHYVAIAGFEALLVVAISNFVHRVVTSFLAATALTLALHEMGATGAAQALMAAGFAAAWLSESAFVRLRPLLRPVGYGLAFLLVHLDAGAAVAGNELWREVERELGISASPAWTGPAIVSAIVLASLVIAIRRAGVAPISRAGLGLLLPLAAAALAGLPAPGVATSLLIMLVGFAARARLLLGVGIVSALGYLSAYYHAMEATLLHKSFVLFLTGAVILAARQVIRSVSRA